jgi:hypothetical protein
MTHVRLQDRLRVEREGYEVRRLERGWWVLLAPMDGWETELSHRSLMVGDHGCASPTEWECYAEALARIEQDERSEELAGAGCGCHIGHDDLGPGACGC